MSSSAQDGIAELQEDNVIAQQLRITWDPFFARFGRLTAAQRAVIRPVLDGRNVLLCAATASGKTEAACAPLIERRLGRTYPWTILYISPTRALVNDLYERLAGPLGVLELALTRRTGDHPVYPDGPPAVLITTPESFDSMMCRARLEPAGHLLAFVDAVVLDEVHLLHGTARGEQVRWLLARLRRLRRHALAEGWVRRSDVQVVGLSATVPDPDRVRTAYLPDGEVVMVPGGRVIEVVGNEEYQPTEVALPSYIESPGKDEKVLVFVNKRKRAEELGAVLKEHLASVRYDVRVHHGSLGQELREATEEVAKRAPRVVIVATSTLEIGIDIGNIDLIVLDGPPPNVPAFLQRIGRGNRRTGATRVMLCAEAKKDELLQRALLASAEQGDLGPAAFGPQHAVARQQCASYIYQAQRRSRSRAALQSLLQDCSTPLVSQLLLDHLVEQGEFLEDGSGIRLSERWLDAGSGPSLHTNIEEGFSQTVIDRDSGKIIAKGIRFDSGNSLTVGGSQFKVFETGPREIDVRRKSGGGSDAESWRFECRGGMFTLGQPAAVRRYLRLEDEAWPVVLHEGRWHVFHLGGDRLKAALALAKHALGDALGISKVTPWLLVTSVHAGNRPAAIESLRSDILRALLPESAPRLERLLGRPKANRYLPSEVRVDEVAAWLDLDRTLELIRASRWTETSPEVRSQLRPFLMET